MGALILLDEWNVNEHARLLNKGKVFLLCPVPLSLSLCFILILFMFFLVLPLDKGYSSPVARSLVILTVYTVKPALVTTCL